MATLKQLVATTEDVLPLFALSRIAHPVVIEMFGLADGYRGFWFDQEHASFSTREIATLSIAARANEMDTIVRMPPTGYWQVTQALEAGAGGVMAAQIYTLDQAQEFVSWAKFPPDGNRGLNSSGFDADYSHKPLSEFVREANDLGLVAIQIETLPALECVSDLAELEGVDFLFVGPADLSLALGVPGQFEHEKLWEAIECVARACERRGVTWGAVVPNPEFARRAVDLGCRLPTVGNDVIALRNGIAALQDRFPLF